MQDFNYLFTNAFELTMELSCCKYPLNNRLLPEWENNINSLLSYVEKANTGVRGRVVSKDGVPVAEANVLVKKNDEGWRESWLTTNQDGNFWRMLVPGNYSVALVDSSDKAHPQLIENVSVQENTPTILEDIVMDNDTSTVTQELSDTIFKMFR